MVLRGFDITDSKTYDIKTLSSLAILESSVQNIKGGNRSQQQNSKYRKADSAVTVVVERVEY